MNAITEAAAPLDIPKSPKTRTTAGRLRAKFEALIDRDDALIADHTSKIASLQLRLNAWQEAISEINTED